MNVDFRYFGRSEVRSTGSGLAVAFAPNLARERVRFDGELVSPVRFREAVSALHEVVVGDLRVQKKDRTAYLEWKRDQEEGLRSGVHATVKAAELDRLSHGEAPEGLEEQFRRMHGVYWRARRAWASELQRSDPALFRALVPCDPVVTVAPDTVFFECFSKDESSYGYLGVDRDAFRGAGDAEVGTTNVDYSLGLYEHFQTLRSYRPSRLLVDPSGFEVSVEGSGDYREEKIDLPSSWLRGFGQLQAAMALPGRTVEVSREALYSVLAWLKRHRERTGPRSIRFRLEPGMPPVLVLDPWGVEIVSHGRLADGVRAEEVKVWGRRRLMALARLLPMADRVEVRLLGTGLPSFWTVYMGDMRFVLALSGWTANDWAGGASLELLSNASGADAETVERVARRLAYLRVATATTLAESLDLERERLLGALFELAKRGQAVPDVAADVYRWRPVLPVELSDAALGPEPPEVAEGRRLFADRKVKVERQEFVSPVRRFVAARVGETHCEAIFDPDNVYSRAKCTCSFFYKSRLRAGPCRHLLALKLHVASAG
jgi:hypothetical protein